MAILRSQRVPNGFDRSSGSHDSPKFPERRRQPFGIPPGCTLRCLRLRYDAEIDLRLIRLNCSRGLTSDVNRGRHSVRVLLRFGCLERNNHNNRCDEDRPDEVCERPCLQPCTEHTEMTCN